MTAMYACFALVCMTGAFIAWPFGIWLGWCAVTRVPPGHCDACAYDRSGVPDADVCPECGLSRWEAAGHLAPGARRGALLRLTLVLLTAIVSCALFTFGMSSGTIGTLIGTIASVICFTGACAWYLIGFVNAISSQRSSFIATWLATYVVIGVFGLLALIEPLSGSATVAVAAGIFVHMLALSFTGWVVLFSASFAAGERSGGTLST